jgi:hypothetical protein
VDEYTKGFCKNFRAILIQKHLGPELASVDAIASSPLFQVERGKVATVDLTNKNLFLRCPWPNLLPHLKLVLGCKWSCLRYVIITDQQIKNVYVGNEQYKNRAFAERDSRPILNSLSDLVADYDLVIIKLGYIGHQNRAAAGALKETLLIRAAQNKPVWLVEDPRHTWLYSHDADVADYIEHRFKVVPIEPANPGDGYEDPEENLGMETTDYEPREASPEPEPEEEASQDESDEEPVDDDICLPKGGKKSYGKKWGRS